MRLVVALLLAVGLIAGCSSGATHHAAPVNRQALYLRLVRAELHATNHAGDADMVRYGHFVCRAWTARGTWTEQIAASRTPNVSAPQAAVLVAAATSAFCPRYRSKLPRGVAVRSAP